MLDFNEFSLLLTINNYDFKAKLEESKFSDIKELISWIDKTIFSFGRPLEINWSMAIWAVAS